MVGELLHERVPLPRWGHYGHRECIAQPVAQSIYENLVLVKGGSVGIFVSRKPGRIRLVGAGVAGKKGGDPWVLTSIGFLRRSARALSRSVFLFFSTLFLLLRLFLGNHRGLLLSRSRHRLRPDLRLQHAHRKRL